ncbi:hypothetical protein HAX54_040563 [Datura stramonium]|uniref:Gag-pol polyprotein n=1 Tax=Datura stramonium TaxID=4076 RepID=A0ABS8VMT5_DATST|nr:hypothetical protein [Datura stramonium]
MDVVFLFDIVTWPCQPIYNANCLQVLYVVRLGQKASSAVMSPEARRETQPIEPYPEPRTPNVVKGGNLPQKGSRGSNTIRISRRESFFVFLDEFTYDENGDDENDEAKEENQSLLTKEESNSKKILALMANFDSDSEDDNCEVNFSEIKNDIHTCSMKKLECVAHIVIDAFESLHTEKDKLMDAYTSLELDHKSLEGSKENLGSRIDTLKNQVLMLINEKSGLETEK